MVRRSSFIVPVLETSFNPLVSLWVSGKWIMKFFLDISFWKLSFFKGNLCMVRSLKFGWDSHWKCERYNETFIEKQKQKTFPWRWHVETLFRTNCMKAQRIDIIRNFLVEAVLSSFQAAVLEAVYHVPLAAFRESFLKHFQYYNRHNFAFASVLSIFRLTWRRCTHHLRSHLRRSSQLLSTSSDRSHMLLTRSADATYWTLKSSWNTR